jgi:hypothetical protein
MHERTRPAPGNRPRSLLGPENVSDRLVAIGSRPLFSVDGETHTWGDVLAHAEARGTLDELRRRARDGAARVALSGAPDSAEVSEAATRFRYARRLLSAEELEEWLARWQLTVAEWGDHLARELLLEEGDSADVDQADGAELGEIEYVDAVCSGFLEQEALELAAHLALGAGGRAAALSEQAVEREFASHRLDWTLLEIDELALDDEGAAREAALCVRVDGRSIADVAAESGGSLEHTSLYLADAGPLVQPSLISAQPGELVGPVEQDGAFVLLAIQGRTPPARTDPDLRARAESALVDRAVKRAMDGRVEWFEDV